MHWFLATLVYRILYSNGDQLFQFNEQIRLIKAEDELHAFHKARLLGEGDRLTELCSTMPGIKWQFIDVTALLAITPYLDGAEIHSCFSEEAAGELYIRSVKKAGTHLLQQSLHQFTGKNSLTINA